MPHNTEELERLSKFENLFHRDNLLLGLRVWLRVNLTMLVVGLVLALTGLLAIFGTLGMALILGISFFLFQWAATVEARRLYGFVPGPWCWWSIVWRLLLYMMPVLLILTLVIGPAALNEQGEFTEAGLQKLSEIQLIIGFLSIIPQGLATSQALLVSLRRYGPLSGGSSGDDPGGDGAE